MYALFATTTSSTLITLMAVFLGSESLVLGYALLVQAAVALLALVVFLVLTVRDLRQIGASKLLDLYRQVVPGWAWFIFWSINTLMIAGEIAFAITHLAKVEDTPWLHHAPLVCGLACTCAITAMYVSSRLKKAV